MENRTPFFLTRLFRRTPQNSEIGEQTGWTNTADNTTFGGWGSPPGSTSSIAITNGWTDEPPENHYNGWGPPTSDSTIDDRDYEKPKTEYNGWDFNPDGKSTTLEASSNGWMTNNLPQSEPINKQSRLVNAEFLHSPPVPSAPPLPDKGFNEHHADNTSDQLCFDFVKKDVDSMNRSKNGNASCVVCWEAPAEGACVPCGHMVSCMPCLREIESKQGTCPVCRAKIDKVLRIYAISTE